MLIPLFLWEAVRPRGKGDEGEGLLRAGDGSGMKRLAALMGVASLVPLLVWRIFVFAARPEWFEGASGGKKRD